MTREQMTWGNHMGRGQTTQDGDGQPHTIGGWAGMPGNHMGSKHTAGATGWPREGGKEQPGRRGGTTQDGQAHGATTWQPHGDARVGRCLQAGVGLPQGTGRNTGQPHAATWGQGGVSHMGWRED